MKNILKGIIATALSGIALTSCTDNIQFGSSFLNKAPGGTMNMDSIFSNPEYVNQFLTNVYNKQYYGLPYKNDGVNSHSPYTGKLDAVTDLYQMHWEGCAVWSRYYQGTMTAKDSPLISFGYEQVWESVHMISLIKENIDNVPNMDEHTKKYIIAQAKALQAFAYSVLLPHYGGLPIIVSTVSDNDIKGGMGKRATFEATVDSIVSWCDQAAPDLYWHYDGGDAETSTLQTGRWTKAGVMALKAQVLWLAASPLFNGDSYHPNTPAEAKELVGYGSFEKKRWERARTAFEEFWAENERQNFHYELVQASKNTPEGYRIAYRRGYIQDDSPEVIHWTKTCDYYGTQGTYCWLNWNTWSVQRLNHSPSVEYIEMFPWADGKPFNHDTDMKYSRTITVEKDGSQVDVYTCLDGKGMATDMDKLFYTYKKPAKGDKPIKKASRDPRLYENARVTGTQESLDFQKMEGGNSGEIQELWVGGQHANDCVKALDGTIKESMTSYCPTGFAAYKYVLSQAEYWRDKDMHWNVLTIPDMILMYAECLAETDKPTDALKEVNKVRARVGLGKLETYNSLNHVKDNKDNIIEEILRERACELGMTNARYIDMVRRKRTDWMTKPLHGMATYRMMQDAELNWNRTNRPWFGTDKDAGLPEPQRFEYEFFPLQQGVRVLWSYQNQPNDPEVLKWLLMPFPQEEVLKGYGLIQNPGW